MPASRPRPSPTARTLPTGTAPAQAVGGTTATSSTTAASGATTATGFGTIISTPAAAGQANGATPTGTTTVVANSGTATSGTASGGTLVGSGTVTPNGGGGDQDQSTFWPWVDADTATGAIGSEEAGFWPWTVQDATAAPPTEGRHHAEARIGVAPQLSRRLGEWRSFGEDLGAPEQVADALFTLPMGNTSAVDGERSVADGVWASLGVLALAPLARATADERRKRSR